VKQALALLVSAALLFGCSQGSKMQEAGKGNDVNMGSIKEIQLITEDGIRLKATVYEADGPGVILLHMLNRDRHDWNDFASQLQSLGYQVIAVDLRGHGESDLNWNDFSPKEFNEMVLDAKAAEEYLGKDVAVIGASIGANIALNVASDGAVKAAILMSPGLEYKGVKSEESIENLDKSVLIIAAEGDTYAAESSRKLHSLNSNAELRTYNGDEHGTWLFGKTDVDQVMIQWLKEHLG